MPRNGSSAISQRIHQPTSEIVTHEANAATVAWSNWNIQYTRSSGTNVYTATTASSSGQSWTVWNQEFAQDMQRAVAAANNLMTQLGHEVMTATNTMNSVISEMVTSWSAWNVQFTSTMSSGTVTIPDNTWINWNIRNASPNEVRRAVERRRPSDEEVRAAQERERQWREEDAKKRREAEEAKVKAEILLRQHLSPEQVDDLEKKNCFFLFVGGEKYQIIRGQHGNVKLLDKDGKVKRSFCIHPSIQVPDADAMLAQKLLLECDKESFYRIANITEYGGRGEALQPARVANANG